MCHDCWELQPPFVQTHPERIPRSSEKVSQHQPVKPCLSYKEKFDAAERLHGPAVVKQAQEFGAFKEELKSERELGKMKAGEKGAGADAIGSSSAGKVKSGEHWEFGKWFELPRGYDEEVERVYYRRAKGEK